jgi:hypothetical protein
MAARFNASLVVIDTMARVVKGKEDDSDTYRDYYNYTGRRLKAAGRAMWRLDHAGKDLTQGQRGSSAKADDVDVVFRLSSTDNGVTLKRTHSRIPWVPAEIALARHDNPLRHELVGALWPEGTAEVARLLDDLKVPLDATVKIAQAALRLAGQGRRTQLVMAGLKWRRERQ